MFGKGGEGGGGHNLELGIAPWPEALLGTGMSSQSSGKGAQRVDYIPVATSKTRREGGPSTLAEWYLKVSMFSDLRNSSTAQRST